MCAANHNVAPQAIESHLNHSRGIASPHEVIRWYVAPMIAPMAARRACNIE